MIGNCRAAKKHSIFECSLSVRIGDDNKKSALETTL